ncbi:VLRF1 family aeRF1-type release factor [Rubrobacter xylanophilus]|nr:VLRF1 family aeRF1-type release factor [Rubrobacter xylanophilus]
MLNLEELQGLKHRVEGFEEPVLSAYLNTNPADPENRNKAYVLRLKDALKELGVPRALAEAALRHVEGLQRPGRTLVLFASQDGKIETLLLQTEMPEEILWGEPHLAPLQLAIDEYQPTGIVLVDAKRFRFFVTSLGQIEEELGAANVFDTAGWREVTISPSSANPQGGMAQDLFERRVEAQTRRFYKELAEEIRRLVSRFGVKRLILAGPEERTAAFAEALPQDTARLVGGRAHLPTGASEAEVLRRVSEMEERLEREEERRLLDEARERGVYGRRRTLEALSEGRVYALIVPWPFSGEVAWCDGCSLAVPREESDGRCPYCGGSTRSRRAADALLDLAASRNARLEFARGENAERLRSELGGLAGLTRF